MSKVIVERPRLGGGQRWKKKRGRSARAEAGEESPGHEGMKSRLVADRRSLNENLALLRRWLLAAVGRPWDKVFADISGGLDVRSALHKHLRDHLRDYVALDVVAGADGGLWAPQRNGWRLVPLSRSTFLVWVDPRTGLLRRVDRTPGRVPRSAPVTRIDLDPLAQLHCLDGIWYHVTLAPIPGDVAAGAHRDVVLRRDLATLVTQGRLLADTFGRPGVFATGRRQLSRDELRQRGLVNGLPSRS
jgi:hypothetical protein